MPVIYRPSIKQLKDQLETQTEEIFIDRLRRDLLAGEEFDKPVLTPHNYRSGDEFVPTRKLKSSTASVSPDGIAPAFEALQADIPDKFGTAEQPKLKFLFTVEFFPRDELVMSETGSQDMNKMAFALKRATRPNPTVNYQDVNFYNYRTKIATKTDYGTTTIAFYDDASNRAHDIFIDYLNTISPISKAAKEDADNFKTTDTTTGLALGSSIGAIENENGPFASIRVTQHTINPDRYNTKTIYNLDAADQDPYTLKIHYDYINPKIINFNLDELDMSQSDVSMVELTFVYDSVSVIYENPLYKSSSSSSSSSPTGTVTIGNGSVDDANGKLGNLSHQLNSMIYKPKKV